MFSPTDAYGIENPSVENPSVYELANNLEDPDTQKKLVAKGSLASMTSMLTTERYLPCISHIILHLFD